jgi:hypothetical protein
MATKPENVNPFAKYVEQSGEEPQDNPFAKFVTPSLDVEQLKAATKKYEEEVPFTQRITDPLKQGIANLSGLLPGLEVSSIQKEINAIREGKRGPRDPLTGEQLPFQPEEQENAIKMLQEQQKEAQAKVMSAQAEAGKFQTRPAVAALSNVDSAREAFQAFQVDPLGVMSSVSLQSLPQIVPSLILGAVTRNPTVGALAMGSTSFAGELSSGVSEYFQEQGINIKDPIEVNKALNDKEMFTKAYEYALTRGSIIGVADTAAAGLASKLLVPKNVIKNQFAKEAVNIGVAQPVAQILSGAGGEAAAQLATEGEVTKPGQVLLEAAGEGPTSVLETAAFGGKEAINRLKATPEAAPEVAPAPTAAPTVEPTAVPPAIITDEAIEAEEGLTPVSPSPTTVAPEAATVPPTPTPTPTPPIPAAATAEIAKRIEELDAELKAIDSAYDSATPEQFTELNARQGEIKSEIARLFKAGTTGAPIAPAKGTIKHDGIEYANTPRIKDLIEKAEAIQSNLPPVQKDMIRLYRGNREGEVGQNPSFTNSLVGIALPFQESYGGSLSYVDIPKSDLAKYESTAGSAPGSEFSLTTELAQQAKPIEVTPAAPVEIPEATAPVEVSTPAETLAPKEEFSMKALQFQNRFIDAEKSGKLTEQQSNQIFNLYNNNKVEEAEKRLNNILRRQEKLAATAKTEEAVTVPPVEDSKFAVDETGEKLDYPLFVDLANKGYQLYSFENPRTYENKGGVKYRTLEKDGVRLALEPRQVLFTDPKKPNQQPQLGMGKKLEVAFHFLGVDPDKRKQGKAKEALQDLIEIADKNKFTLYGEPAQLEKESMTRDQLLDLYKQYGFAPTDSTNKVIVRKPGAKAIPVEKPKELVGAEKKLDYIIKNKDSIVKQLAENYKISPEYAAKAYDAELEYTRAASRAYGDHPNKISEKDFKAAIKKHDTFFNKLKGVSSRVKEKEAAAPVEAKKTQAEINRDRQAEKKAAAEKAKQPLNTSAVPDADKIRKKNGYVIYKRKSDMEYWRVQSVENKLENRIGEGDSAHSDLGTAEDKIYSNINEEESRVAEKKEAKPVEKKVEKAEPVKTKTKKAASTEEEQLIQDAVLFAKAAERTNLTEEKIRDTVENARIADPATVISKLKNSVENLKKQAKDYLVRKVSDEYREQVGGKISKDSELVNAIKGGALNIEGKEFAEAFYKLYKIDPAKIKKAKAGNPVENQLVKFESGVFTDVDANPEIYKEAAIKFLESPLTAKLPSRNQAKIDAKPLKDVTPLPIEKKVVVKNKTYEDHKSALTDFTAPQDIRYYLKGVYMDKVKGRMMATDGHRGAIINNANFDGSPQLIKGKDIVAPDNSIIEGQFPDMDRVVPKKHLVKAEIINTKEIGDYARGVQKAWRYIDSKYNPVILKIGGKDVGFNSDYIVDMSNLFARMGYDTFKASVDSNGKLFATSPDDRVQQVVMAMREPETPFSTYAPEKTKKVTKKSGAADLEKPADKPYYNDFTSNIDYNELYKRAEVSREDRIKEYAQTRAASRRALKKIAKYGSDIPMQRELNELLNKEEMLKVAVSINKPRRNTAADFIARATQEMANENLAPEVEAVIRQVYQKYPGVLEGLRLSLRTRKAGGNEAGNFNPYTRIVTLWKDSSGVEDVSTIRHELTHSLEQMMTPAAREAIVQAWARSFETAIKQNPDKKSQEFFNKVFDFLDNPSKKTFDDATSIMPSYDLYQYMNPSEYWAVNAEKLMAAKLGTPWARFVSAVKKLFEGLKSVFGVNNTFTVHKEFDNLINGKLERTKNEEMLIDYLLKGKVKLDFLNSIEDVNELLDKHNRPEAPRKPSLSVRDAFMGGYDNTKETVKDVLTSPVIATNNMIGKADRALTYFRNKNIFFGYGLEEADRQRYGGQIRNAHQQAIASVAVVNALHSGNIATQVMTQGKLVFDKDTQMFVAAKSDKSMANVVREKAALIDKLGFETGNRVIQSYFEAKRSRSIVNEYLNREAAYEAAIESGQKEEEARRDLANIEKAVEKVNMDDEVIDDFIALENQYPELRKMMDNWTAVNQNMIDMMEFSGIISKQRAKSLRSIKDYVPWYRIMDDQEDIHSAPKGTRGLTNVAADKKFGPGKTERDIDDIVDNMIHNVLTITRNSARNYAANRVVMEYGDRYTEGKNAGKLRVFPSEGSDADGVRFNIIAAGRRIVVRIKDPLVAESVIGMENIDIPMNGALAFMANTLRRSITTFPAFQVAQLFMDAPTAALVTGLKNPAAVWSGVFTSFLKNLRKDDPIVAKLRAAGIGGYQSSARTPEKEIQLDIGLIQGSWFSKAMKGLDRFGDASDYAQRRSVYLQTMKETGDEMLALFQANNVIDFKKRGSGQIAQLVTKQVAFMNAYAQAIDVLAKGLAGTGLKGIDRKKALARMATTAMLLSSATLVYCMLVGDDDEYNKLDDQTKMRTIFIPGLDMRLPMHSGAAFFFKAIPELLYNVITKEGTKDEYDRKRITRALSRAAADALLGPNPTPTGVKPVIEIALNRNFFTGGQVTPRGMEDLAAFRQYNQNTSELGKIISALTGTEKTRLLNPIEADHLVRGLTGTVGAAVMWGTNLLSGDRPTPQAKDNPFYGQFIMPDVPRGREDLYYDLKEKTDEAYKTHQDLLKKGRKEEAAEWFKENKQLIQIYGYTSAIETDLKSLNGEIRRLSDLPGNKMSPDAKRKRMTELQEIKARVLKDVISMRKRAGFDD